MSESYFDNDNYDYYRDNQQYIEELGITADELLQAHPAVVVCQHDAHSGATVLTRTPDDDVAWFKHDSAAVTNAVSSARHYMTQAYPDVTRYFSGQTPQDQPTAWSMATAFSRADWRSGCFIGGDEAVIVTKTSFCGAILYATAERFDITRHYGNPNKQQRFIITWVDDVFVRAEVFQQYNGMYPANGLQPDAVSLAELEAKLRDLQR